MLRNILSHNNNQLPRLQGKYDTNFSEDWVQNHLLNVKQDLMTGPKTCLNCRTYSSINNVFVFYCTNCIQIYNGTRGGCIYCSEYTSEAELWKEFPLMR